MKYLLEVESACLAIEHTSRTLCEGKTIELLLWLCSLENDDNEIFAIAVTALVALPAGVFMNLMYFCLSMKVVWKVLPPAK